MFLLCRMIFASWHYRAIELETCKLQRFIAFHFFLLNFDVTSYFNNRLLLVVCSVYLIF